VTYEIISIENGDVLSLFDEREAAVQTLLDYVERNRASHPGIEDQVGLLALDDARHREELVMARDLMDEQHAAVRA
jgi:hypothetical protein